LILPGKEVSFGWGGGREAYVMFRMEVFKSEKKYFISVIHI
jgi:hypothetical protein